MNLFPFSLLTSSSVTPLGYGIAFSHIEISACAKYNILICFIIRNTSQRNSSGLQRGKNRVESEENRPRRRAGNIGGLPLSFILPLWTTGKALTKIAEKGIQGELLLLLGEVRRVRPFQINDTGTAGAAVKNQSSSAPTNVHCPNSSGCVQILHRLQHQQNCAGAQDGHLNTVMFPAKS